MIQLVEDQVYETRELAILAAYAEALDQFREHRKSTGERKAFFVHVYGPEAPLPCRSARCTLAHPFVGEDDWPWRDATIIYHIDAGHPDSCDVCGSCGLSDDN